MDSLKIVTLKSNSGHQYVVELKVAKLSPTITELLETYKYGSGKPEDVVIPLLDVDGPTLDKVISWCIKHQDDPPVVEEDYLNYGLISTTSDLDKWEIEFFKVSNMVLLKILAAASDLQILKLQLNACKFVAELVRDRTPDDIAENFSWIRKIYQSTDSDELTDSDESTDSGESINFDELMNSEESMNALEK